MIHITIHENTNTKGCEQIMVHSMIRPVPVDIEPKRKNRWVLEFPSDMGIEEWMVQTTTRPSMAIGEVEIPYMNTSTYVAGRVTWEGMDITFIDPIGPSTSQAVMKWIYQCVVPESGRMGFAASYKKELVLKLLGPAGTEVEKWVIRGAWPVSASFGDLDYSSEDLAEVTVSIKFDYAILDY